MSAYPHVSEALERSIHDIVPKPFNERLAGILADRPLTPAAATVATGLAIDRTADRDKLATLGIGVQLGYEGLRLTRRLIQQDSWLGTDRTTDEDIDILAAEVLVARGMNLLTRTGTVTQAVDVVKRFGQRAAFDRTETAGDGLGTLEMDIIKLAVDTGADAVLQSVPPPIASLGAELATRLDTDPIPEPEIALEGFQREVDQVYHLHEPPLVEDPSSSSTVDP